MIREIAGVIDIARNASAEEKSFLVWAENDTKYQHTALAIWRARHSAKKFVKRHQAEWAEVDQAICDLPYKDLRDDLALRSIRYTIMALFSRTSITEQDFHILTASYKSVFRPCEGASNAG
jgi:hypothetical protein